MNKLNVSIIIPCFNTGCDLFVCLNSVCTSYSLPSEIIIIENGEDIIIKKIFYFYKRKYKNVIDMRKVFFKENIGYGSAVNIGISMAKSEYICFIDSDDKISKDYLHLLYSRIIENNVDFVKANFMYVVQGKESIGINLNTNKDILLIGNRKNCLLEFHPSIWSCIYKKSFLIANKIRFSNSIYFWVDNIFQLNTIRRSRSIYFITKPLYFYNFDLHKGVSDVSYNPQIILNTIDQFILCDLDNVEKNFLKKRIVNYLVNYLKVSKISHKILHFFKFIQIVFYFKLGNKALLCKFIKVVINNYFKSKNN